MNNIMSSDYILKTLGQVYSPSSISYIQYNGKVNKVIISKTMVELGPAEKH